MTDTTFETFCPGMLEVLSIGKGDLKLTLAGDNEADTTKARALIEEMLRKGYAIFVETDEGPVRVHEFNPWKMCYVIRDSVEEEPSGTEGQTPASEGKAPAKPARTRRATKKLVPVAGSKATAVGRTAGG